uniref:Dual specificity protein kinase splB-like isoform X2 n=1 Tax=Dermatophagoides pteronyssinus TaxID=6956 RepID=A0A6P6XJP9_DERPT|nr:dual specificity protein kinase splB-like isoform X2 [Dermatophagoides pteronyssinus]
MPTSPISDVKKINMNKRRSSTTTTLTSMDSTILDSSPLSMDSGFESNSSSSFICDSIMSQKSNSESLKDYQTKSFNLDDSLKLIEQSKNLDGPSLALVIKENHENYMKNLNLIIETFNSKFDLNNNKSNESTVADDNAVNVKDGNGNDDLKMNNHRRRSSMTNVMMMTNSNSIDSSSSSSSKSTNNPNLNIGRRNSTQLPIGTDRFLQYNHHQRQQQQSQQQPPKRHFRFPNLYSKSAPISDNCFGQDLVDNDNYEWRLGKIGEKFIGKMDKGALFTLNETFFDRKELVSKTFFHQMLAETAEIQDDDNDDNCQYSNPAFPYIIISGTEMENIQHSTINDTGLDSTKSSSSFSDIVAKSLPFNNDIKQQQQQQQKQRSLTTNITGDFSFHNVLGKGSINKIIDNNDDKLKQQQQQQSSSSSSDTVNRSIFGNIHGLNNLINQPAVVVNGHSNLIVPYSSTTTTSSSSLSSSSITSNSNLLTQQQRTNNLNAIAYANDELEIRARKHREEASRVDQCQSIFSINRFEFKPQTLVKYSVKVFLGGVPWDMTNEDMLEAFRHYGVLAVQRPGKEVRPSRSSRDLSKAGYLYLIFDDSRSVERLIAQCNIAFDSEGPKYIYSLQSKHSRKLKNVQIIPWDKKDSSHYRTGFHYHGDTLADNNNNENIHSSMIDESRMVFLGALHGMLNSRSIFEALQRIFGPVDYVILETDRFDYPMGFGRAQFSTTSAYQRAINARFVKVLSLRFKKTIQIDPYLEDQKCSQCYYEDGPVYCFECRDYFCRVCFTMKHSEPGKELHKILMKKVSSTISTSNNNNSIMASATASTSSSSMNPAIAAIASNINTGITSTSSSSLSSSITATTAKLY